MKTSRKTPIFHYHIYEKLQPLGPFVYTLWVAQYMLNFCTPLICTVKWGCIRMLHRMFPWKFRNTTYFLYIKTYDFNQIFKRIFRQRFNTAGWFLFWMFMWNNFGSMVNNGLLGVVLSSIETRFGLTSTESSWIVTSYDVAGMCAMETKSHSGK